MRNEHDVRHLAVFLRVGNVFECQLFGIVGGLFGIGAGLFGIRAGLFGIGPGLFGIGPLVLD